jgi:hypothetical protein
MYEYELYCIGGTYRRSLLCRVGKEHSKGYSRDSTTIEGIIVLFEGPASLLTVYVLLLRCSFCYSVHLLLSIPLFTLFLPLGSYGWCHDFCSSIPADVAGEEAHVLVAAGPCSASGTTLLCSSGSCSLCHGRVSVLC